MLCGLGKQVTEAKEGPFKTGLGGAQDKLLLPAALLITSIMGTLRTQEKESTDTHLKKEGEVVLQTENALGPCFKGFLSKGRNFRGGLRGDLNRIFISFPGVSFNMLTHQSEHIDHSLVSFTFKECYLKETRTDRSTLAWSGMCKIKDPCNLLSGCKLLTWFVQLFVSVSVSPFHFPNNHPSFLLSCPTSMSNTKFSVVISCDFYFLH